ncbi:MbtH family protein [Streptosporangium algeriense]|uniref:MbtH family protein n=1 Tax=Streptosporangium algeriense TaxID=1682748 RepID=A0ABW3DTC6_9ACTN
MANPFEDPDSRYFVLVNDEGQYSLWPTFSPVPAGWEVVFGDAARQECLDHIERSWTDMRPKSLIAAMEDNS